MPNPHVHVMPHTPMVRHLPPSQRPYETEWLPGLFERFRASIRGIFDHFGPSTIAEIRCKFDHFGPQKGRWARNGTFPLNNGLFLVNSTIAEIRCNFGIPGLPKGRWARNGPQTRRYPSLKHFRASQTRAMLFQEARYGDGGQLT